MQLKVKSYSEHFFDFKTDLEWCGCERQNMVGFFRSQKKYLIYVHNNISFLFTNIGVTQYWTTDLMENPIYVQFNSYWIDIFATGLVPLLFLCYMNMKIFFRIKVNIRLILEWVIRSELTLQKSCVIVDNGGIHSTERGPHWQESRKLSTALTHSL